MSRKRFRPLDAAEMHSVHVEQTLYVGALDDERSYCFSWPEVPLTALLNQRTTGQDGGDAALPHAVQGGRASREESQVAPRIRLPPVYDVDTLLGELDAGAGDDAMDVACLLHPLREGCLVRMPRDAQPRCGPHPLAPSRLLRGSSTEDSVFSFTAGQWREVCEGGVLDGIARATPPEAAPRTVHGEDDLATRRVAEAEVVGLEWRAFRESSRTAAALQRLLTLEAAVPFTPCTASLSPSSSQDATALAPQAAVVVNEWRHTLYKMWLGWRRVPTAPDTRKPESNAEKREEGRVAPWGPPLLAGAFLYGTQSDYFLDTDVLAANTGAERGGKPRRDASRAVVRDGAGCDAPTVSSRRRGVYGFLRWRLDRHTSAAPAEVVVVDDDSTSGTSADASRPVVYRTVTRGSASHGVLSGDKVEAIITADILTRPLTAVELVDGVEDDEVSWRSLALLDLKRETEAWQSWLSKM